MGNSIEEDIKLLREMKNNCLNRFEYYTDPKAREKAEALEHILSDYKRVLKENAKLKNKLLDTLEGQKVIKEETPQYIKENYIPKQKVKDKIEELNSRIEIYRKYVQQGIETDVEWVDNVADRETLKVLQELIEESEKK